MISWRKAHSFSFFVLFPTYIWCLPTYRSNSRRFHWRGIQMEGAQICRAFIIRATNSCSSAEVPLGSFPACVPEKWCSGLEKCLLMPPFLFTVIRERKAPAVLVSSISPGLWPTQGLKWTINQTHISDQTHGQQLKCAGSLIISAGSWYKGNSEATWNHTMLT